MKFSIRDLLLLTVIAALAAAWWVDRRSSREERLRMEHIVEDVREREAELQVLAAELRQGEKDLLDKKEQLRKEWGRSIVDRTGFTAALPENRAPETPKEKD